MLPRAFTLQNLKQKKQLAYHLSTFHPPKNGVISQLVPLSAWKPNLAKLWSGSSPRPKAEWVLQSLLSELLCPGAPGAHGLTELLKD